MDALSVLKFQRNKSVVRNKCFPPLIDRLMNALACVVLLLKNCWSAICSLVAVTAEETKVCGLENAWSVCLLSITAALEPRQADEAFFSAVYIIASYSEVFVTLAVATAHHAFFLEVIRMFRTGNTEAFANIFTNVNNLFSLPLQSPGSAERGVQG